MNMDYTMNNYLKDIDKKGLKKTWHSILSKTLAGKFSSEIFIIDNYGDLYEIGLEHVNKISKKEMGKYYTPRDVADIMSKWLKKLPGENICDVGCGVGNLTLSYLEMIGRKKAQELLEGGNLYLYDMDEVALEICKYSIAIKYGREFLKTIHIRRCDFLNKRIRLPRDCKVISNPPYYKITEYEENWKITNVITDTKEFYSAFMEKIMTQSLASVIITPYSYIGSEKFYSLRKLMNHYNGFAVSFDNVPGSIFNGRKHGVFNSNKGNSVRAAITVVENKEGVNGFRFSPLIRFKNEERERVLNNSILESIVNEEYQLVNQNEQSFYKCHKDLLTIFDIWKSESTEKMNSIITMDSEYKIDMPTTCRYFTVGSKKSLLRDGKRIICVKEKDKYNYVYCMLNSTFAYWYWRIYDGGINYPFSIFNNIPIFYDLLDKNAKNKIDKIAKEMQANEKKYLVYKLNAGKVQENVKFPEKYRNEINKIFFEVLGIKEDISILNKVHSSALFEERGEEEYD